MARSSTAAVAAAAMIWAWGCASAPPRVALPTGSGTPASDGQAWLQQATAECAAVASLTTEMAMRGRIASRRVRARVLAGTEATGRVRLEGVAPFGAPLFVLASDGTSATLLLPRDDRAVTGHSFEEVLDALAGVRLDGADLHAALTGCGLSARTSRGARAFGDAWRAVDLESGATMWLSRTGQDTARVAAVELPQLAIEYVGGGEAGDGAGRTVRLVTPAGTERQRAVDLRLEMSQVERNGVIDARAFEVDVPADATPMSLAELRRNGLLGQ